jgi:hypothetical protein
VPTNILFIGCSASLAWWRESRTAIWVSRSGDGPYYLLFSFIMIAAAVEGSVLFLQRALIALPLSCHCIGGENTLSGLVLL